MVLLLAAALPAGAEERKLPRFVSLSAPEANMRTGPGLRYPIEWVLVRRDLPLEVIGEHDAWRRVRDYKGTVGWVHRAMLTGRRTVLVTGKRRALRNDPEKKAPPVAWLDPGVIATLERCTDGWCRVIIDKQRGWLRVGEFWGAYKGEKVE